MNIGIEVSSLINSHPTGIARYITQLIMALVPKMGRQDSLRLFYKLSRRSGKKIVSRIPGVEAFSYYKNLWPFRKKVDLIHLLDSTIMNWRNVKRVITIHDLFVLIHADDQIAPKKFREKKNRVYEQIIKTADAIIADSISTREDICRLYGVPAKKIEVVHLGIDHQNKPVDDHDYQTTLSSYGLEPGYLLFLGAISGRKNTERLVRAFAASKAVRERKLVLAGSVSYKGERTLSAIEACGLHQKILVTGYVPEAHVPALFRGAAAFVFPTLYEGFGMPILEAMSRGVPVLTSTTGSAPEISAGHALCVDPYQVGAIAEGIDHVLKMDQKSLDNARAYSRKFTWDRCAGKTLDVYHQTLT